MNRSDNYIFGIVNINICSTSSSVRCNCIHTYSCSVYLYNTEILKVCIVYLPVSSEANVLLLPQKRGKANGFDIIITLHLIILDYSIEKLFSVSSLLIWTRESKVRSTFRHRRKFQRIVCSECMEIVTLDIFSSDTQGISSALDDFIL